KVLATPLRLHRTGFQKTAQVVAGSLMREVEQENRELVVFSDSLQDAAKLAAGMERDHYRDMIRIALLDALRESSKDLAAAVRQTIWALSSRGLDRQFMVSRIAMENLLLAEAVSLEPE